MSAPVAWLCTERMPGEEPASFQVADEATANKWLADLRAACPGIEASVMPLCPMAQALAEADPETL